MALWVSFCGAIIFFRNKLGPGRKQTGNLLETNWLISGNNLIRAKKFKFQTQNRLCQIIALIFNIKYKEKNSIKEK